MVRVGVVLCGCGRFDGSEIHESVLTLLHLARAGAELVCMAPDEPQWAVCEHFEGRIENNASRNMLQEAARIARGEIQTLAEVSADQLDALVMPGGSGAARNLCDFANRGHEAEVLPELQALIEAMHTAGKPLGAICISPAIVALVLGRHGVRLTLGGSPENGGPASRAAKTGAQMIPCPASEIVIDPEHRIVSTPAYVLARSISEVDQGIGKLIAEVLRLAKA